MARAMKPAAITLSLSAAAVLGYLAYRLTTDAPEESVPALAATESSGEALLDQLPEFTLQNLAGERQSIRDWPGQPLIVNFWATWCGPCLREIPMLNALQEANPWLTILGIAVDDENKVRQFAADMDFGYPVLMGETGPSEAVNAAGGFGVDFYALPFTIFTDADGRMLGVHTGELHQEHLDTLLGVLRDLDAGRIDVAAARGRIAGRR